MDLASAVVRPLDADNYRFLVADLRAAAWCLGNQHQSDDALLGRRFLSIHQFFLRNLGRSSRPADAPPIFASVDASRLVDIVRRWIVLYLATLTELNERFPRTEHSPDLVMLDENWSSVLGVAFDGLDRIDSASRYAEFWAERGMSDSTVHDSYKQRLAFIGSPFYVACDTLNREGRLHVLDAFRNGVTSFDLFNALHAHSDTELPAFFAAKEWYPLRWPADSVAALRRVL